MSVSVRRVCAFREVCIREVCIREEIQADRAHLCLLLHFFPGWQSNLPIDPPT